MLILNLSLKVNVLDNVILTVDGVGVTREVRAPLYLREALPDSVRHCLVSGQVLSVTVESQTLHAPLEPFYLRHLQQTQLTVLKSQVEIHQNNIDAVNMWKLQNIRTVDS